MRYNKYFSLDQDKAIEVMVYFAKNAPIPDIYHLAKVSYFADLLHLERYGRPICGDEYVKMDNGPVPSAIYSLFKSVRDFNHRILLKAFEVEENNLIAKRDADLDYFSPSDIECLDESIALHGEKSFGQLKDESHDEAWHSAEDNRTINYSAMINMLPNAKRLTEYLNA